MLYIMLKGNGKSLFLIFSNYSCVEHRVTEGRRKRDVERTIVDSESSLFLEWWQSVSTRLWYISEMCSKFSQNSSCSLCGLHFLLFEPNL